MAEIKRKKKSCKKNKQTKTTRSKRQSYTTTRRTTLTGSDPLLFFFILYIVCSESQLGSVSSRGPGGGRWQGDTGSQKVAPPRSVQHCTVKSSATFHTFFFFYSPFFLHIVDFDTIPLAAGSGAVPKPLGCGAHLADALCLHTVVLQSGAAPVGAANQVRIRSC